ncbi:hypothetical protein BR93DRAFT_392918 [Coniochaeta sp. PMI_546]|nr:hypothetical protein BR93DRAFT_392918 [Coniochaeta sp. PMI_546]
MQSLIRLSLVTLVAVAASVFAAAIDQRATCNSDNLLRCLVGRPSLAASFCSSSAGVIVSTPTVYVASTPTVYATTSVASTSTGTTTRTISTTTTTPTTTTLSTVTTDLKTTTLVATDTVKSITTTVSIFTSVTVSTRTQTIYNFAWKNKRAIEDKRAALKTSLACIAPLNPVATAVASACSCFSGEYTAPAVTVMTATDPTTIYITTATLVSP